MVSPKRKHVLFRMFMMVFNFNQLLFYRTVRDHRHKAAIYLYRIPFTTFPLFPICTEMWVIKFEFDMAGKHKLQSLASREMSLSYGYCTSGCSQQGFNRQVHIAAQIPIKNVAMPIISMTGRITTFIW